MTERKLDPEAVLCARRLDGHQYQRLHRTYNFNESFDTFMNTGNWKHLSIVEAMATMSLLEKALQVWTRSKNVEEEFLEHHFKAFNSLYLLLKDFEAPREL